jgi:hypothetical protein
MRIFLISQKAYLSRRYEGESLGPHEDGGSQDITFNEKLN